MRGGGRVLQLNKLRGVSDPCRCVRGLWRGLLGRGCVCAFIGRGALQMRVNIAGSVFLFTVIMSSDGTVEEN